MISWSAADVTYAILYGAAAEPPYPSVSDALWLAFYPASYAPLVLLVRSRMRGFTASLWLDGLIGAFAAALVFQSVLASTEGGVAAVSTNLAYPLGDLLLIALVVGVFGLSRPTRAPLALEGWRTLAFPSMFRALRPGAAGLHVCRRSRRAGRRADVRNDSDGHPPRRPGLPREPAHGRAHARRASLISSPAWAIAAC